MECHIHRNKNMIVCVSIRLIIPKKKIDLRQQENEEVTMQQKYGPYRSARRSSVSAFLAACNSVLLGEKTFVYKSFILIVHSASSIQNHKFCF